MILQMYVEGELLDSTPLSLRQIEDAKERDVYIQNAIRRLLEIWNDVLRNKNANPEFFIRP